jgi:cell division protein FtsQ
MKKDEFNNDDFYEDDHDDDYEEDDGYESEKKVKRMLLGGVVVIILLVAVILASVRIKSFKVIGNNRYTSEEMVSEIFSDRWDTNAFYCFWKDKTKPHKQIPFVQRYDINWEGPLSVSVTVYEKNIVGYVDYMSSHMYFDKDGIVVESTGDKLEGIPKITGLSFGSIILYKELPVRNMNVFNDILNLTGSLSDNEIKCDEIAYDELLNATLKMGDIQVYLGSNKDMEMKIYTLKDILPKLEGMKGTLNLSDYNESSDHESYIFRSSD